MDPYVMPITIRRGDTKEIFIRARTAVWNDTLNVWEPGPYKDLTGYTFLAQIRLTDDTLVATFTITVSDQSDLVNGRGSILLKISDEITLAISSTYTTASWDLKFTEPDGDTFTYVEGAVTLKKGISHA